MTLEGGIVGKMIVRKVEYDVRLQYFEPTKYDPQGRARFTIRVSGKDIHAETWDALYKLAMVASKEAAVKVNVPVLRLVSRRHSSESEGRSFSAVTLTGKHAANGNFLIRYSARDGRAFTEQIDRYHRLESFYAPMSVAEQREGLRLMEAERVAREALEKWNREHGASLGTLYEAAEAEAMEKLDREEGR